MAHSDGVILVVVKELGTFKSERVFWVTGVTLRARSGVALRPRLWLGVFWLWFLCWK